MKFTALLLGTTFILAGCSAAPTKNDLEQATSAHLKAESEIPYTPMLEFVSLIEHGCSQKFGHASTYSCDLEITRKSDGGLQTNRRTVIVYKNKQGEWAMRYR